MRSRLFHTNRYTVAERRIKDFLNTRDRFLSGSTARSTRAVGDAIQDILTGDFPTIVGEDICAEYSSQFARRAMADMAFNDPDGTYVCRRRKDPPLEHELQHAQSHFGRAAGTLL